MQRNTFIASTLPLSSTSNVDSLCFLVSYEVRIVSVYSEFCVVFLVFARSSDILWFLFCLMYSDSLEERCAHGSFHILYSKRIKARPSIQATLQWRRPIKRDSRAVLASLQQWSRMESTQRLKSFQVLILTA